MHPRKQPDHGGFSRAIVTQQAQNLARLDLKIDVVQHINRAETFVDALQGQQCVAHHFTAFFGA